LRRILWRGELKEVRHSIQRVPIPGESAGERVWALERPLLRERAESVTVGAFDLPAVDDPTTVATREPINAREESRGERVERSRHGRRGEREYERACEAVENGAAESERAEMREERSSSSSGSETRRASSRAQRT